MKLQDITQFTLITTMAERHLEGDGEPFGHPEFSEFEPLECYICGEWVEKLYELNEEDVCEICLWREVNKANAEPLQTLNIIYSGVI